MSARIALSHLISSSSLGAQRRRVRFVVTILNVCDRCVASPSSGEDEEGTGGDVADGDVTLGTFRCAGRSYSSASNIIESGI